ncbi:hypothetical protein [Burkholderia sp. IMCC1007]|uniref:hypothetical protein n=1 Tax=Burkholderia sp. IMCC1007 TaxID=3004104 RepID=UPI002F963244
MPSILEAGVGSGIRFDARGRQMRRTIAKFGAACEWREPGLGLASRARAGRAVALRFDGAAGSVRGRRRMTTAPSSRARMNDGRPGRSAALRRREMRGRSAGAAYYKVDRAAMTMDAHEITRDMTGSLSFFADDRTRSGRRKGVCAATQRGQFRRDTTAKLIAIDPVAGRDGGSFSASSSASPKRGRRPRPSARAARRAGVAVSGTATQSSATIVSRDVSDRHSDA